MWGRPKPRLGQETSRNHPRTPTWARGHKIWPMALPARENVTFVTEFGAWTGHKTLPRPEKETKWCDSWTIKGRID